MLTLGRLDAVIFDADGVITDTASVHEAAWRRLFDQYLSERARRTDEELAPFTHEDYRRHVDGRPRYDGVRSILAARGIELPEGLPRPTMGPPQPAPASSRFAPGGPAAPSQREAPAVTGPRRAPALSEPDQQESQRAGPRQQQRPPRSRR